MRSLPLLAVLLAALAGCAPAYLARTTRFGSGEERDGESYDFKESKLSRSEDGGLVVELSRSEYRGLRFLIFPPIHDVSGVRIRLPADIEEGREYAIGDNACTVEFRRHTDLGLWRPLGPGTIRVTRWNPERPYLAAGFTILRVYDDGGSDTWVGSFSAAP